MLYFFDIGQSRNVPINLSNVPQYKISRKTVHWEPVFPSRWTDRVRHDEADDKGMTQQKAELVPLREHKRR